MITKFKKPVKTLSSQIDELYDGKYVAYQDTPEMFGEGLCFVVATGDKTDEVYDELWRYVDELREKTGVRGSVCVGNKHRYDDELYVVISNVQ